MNKLLFLCFLIISFDQAKAFNDVNDPLPLDLFRDELAKKFGDYTDALLVISRPNEKETINDLKSIMRGKAYDTCTDPGIFTSKNEQIRACLKVSQQSSQASKKANERQQRLINSIGLSKKETSFKNFINDISVKHRKVFATETYNNITNLLSEQLAAIQAGVRKHNVSLERICGPKKLEDSVKCSFKRTIQFLKYSYAENMWRANARVAAEGDKIYQQIESYNDKSEFEETNVELKN